MTEAEMNRIVGASLAFRFKIPDGGSHGKLPFDGFGIYKPTDGEGIAVYWESKNLKRPEAFNFNDLQQHQIDSLRAIAHLSKNVMPFFLVCVDFGRAEKRVYAWRDMDYLFQRKAEKRNILKKEWMVRKNFVLIKKQLIDFHEIVAMPREWEYDLSVSM